MNKATLVVMVTLAGLVPSAFPQTDFASCVTRPFDPVCQVMGGVYRQRAEIETRYRVEKEINRWRNAADLYGVRDYAGRAIAPAIVGATSGYRDEYDRPISGGTSRKKAGIVSSIITGGVTYGVTRDWKAAAVAAGTSGLMSAAFAGGGHGDRELDCRKPLRKMKDWERQACADIARQEKEVERQAQDRAMEAEREQTRRVERVERDRRGGFHKNLTPFPLRISCGEVDQVLGPGRRVFLPEPSCNGGYRVEVLEPSGDMPGVREDRELGDGRFRSTISEDGRGWVYFYDRPVRRQGGVR